jgi:hypothetical protein
MNRMGARFRAPICFIFCEEIAVVIPDTPHPFWLFHPWFDSTVDYVDEFLQRTMKRVRR